MMRLGVNVDHVATLRQARGTMYPDPVVGALLAEYGGADSIVVHLREDRRHIQERDVFLIKKAVKVPVNLEMSVNRDIVEFALYIVPHQATLVPEKRLELTTEGGLDLKKNYTRVRRVVDKLKDKGIKVSLFIDPLCGQVDAAVRMGVDMVEFNTGRFSESETKRERAHRSRKIREAASYAAVKGLAVAAGHGLDYDNVRDIAQIPQIEELNIGHSIVSRSVFVGMVSAVEEMKEIIVKARRKKVVRRK